MSDSHPLGRIIALLDQARIPHMLTGSFASTFHGPPRSTQDIDAVLSKLEWAKKGESERQLRDVVGVLAARGEQLGLPYIERWVGPLSVRSLWEQAQRLAALR